MRDFSRYSLYGEDNAAIAAEFLHIEPISARSSRYEWTITAHSHPGIFQILLLERGGGTLVADDRALQLAPTALMAIPSGSIHSFAFAADAEGWVLSLASALVSQLGAEHRAGVRDLCATRATSVAMGLEPRPARRLSWLLTELADDFMAQGAGCLTETRLASLALVFALCSEVLDGGEGGRAPPAGTDARHERLAQRFRTLVEAHFREGWAISRYAEALGTSAPTLTRACQLVLRRSPHDAVLDRVQLEAMRALTYTATGIGRIADDLGFADPAYFARFFKARTGMTASRFRSERAWLAEASAAPRRVGPRDRFRTEDATGITPLK